MQSINVIAEQCGAHPSILVRFAQHFGFSGFKQLRAVFQTRLSTAAPGYRSASARWTPISKTKKNGILASCTILVVRDIATLRALNTVSERSLLPGSYGVERRRRFIVEAAAIQAYRALSSLCSVDVERRVVLLSPASGLAPEMAQVVGPRFFLSRSRSGITPRK